MHQLATDNKIHLNIVFKCFGYLCFSCALYAFYVLLMGSLCAITLQFVIIYLCYII